MGFPDEKDFFGWEDETEASRQGAEQEAAALPPDFWKKLRTKNLGGKPLPNNGRPSSSRGFDGKTMPWGKHRGEYLDRVPAQYIGWIFSEQIAGNMILEERLATALFAAFLEQLREVPVYARAIDALSSRITRVEADGRRAPVVQKGEEV